jgi:carbamoyltransferase
MYILGINAFHGDASASLISDGKLIAAVEEERFNRIKHWAGFPTQSIQYCLEVANIKASNLDRIAVSYNPQANLDRKLRFTLSQRPSLKSLLDRFSKQSKSNSIKDFIASACQCEPDSITAQIHSLEHHATHLASSFFVSPFSEAAILSIDGMGNFVSTLLAAGKDNQVKSFGRINLPRQSCRLVSR